MAGRRKYKFTLENDLEKYMRLKQAKITMETRKPVTLMEVQQMLADYAGISFSTVNSIKQGVSSPALVVAMAMAEFLGARVDEIFTIVRKEDNEKTEKE